jgi:hypothetical protein
MFWRSVVWRLAVCVTLKMEVRTDSKGIILVHKNFCPVPQFPSRLRALVASRSFIATFLDQVVFIQIGASFNVEELIVLVYFLRTIAMLIETLYLFVSFIVADSLFMRPLGTCSTIASVR